MNQSEAEARLVVEMTRNLVAVSREIDASWRRGFLRIKFESQSIEVKGSVELQSEIVLIDAFDYDEFMEVESEKARLLFGEMGKDRGIILLVVDAKMNYEMKFEYFDMDRWSISKMDGNSGIPIGFAD